MALPMVEDHVRTVVLNAMSAASFGAPLDPGLAELVRTGREVVLDDLGFDSLAWMEFCIAVELQTRLELLTSDIETMATLGEIEEWLRERTGHA